MGEISPAPQQIAEASVQDAKSFDKTQDKPAAKSSEKNFQPPLKKGEDGIESARLAKEQSDKYLDSIQNATKLPQDKKGNPENPADKAAKEQEAKVRAMQEAQENQQKMYLEIAQMPPGERQKAYDFLKKNQGATDDHIEQIKTQVAAIDAEKAKIDAATSPSKHDTEEAHESTISSQASDEPVKSQEEKNAAINKAVEPIKKILENPVVKAMTFPLKVLKAVFIDIPVRFLQWAIGWIKGNPPPYSQPTAA